MTTTIAVDTINSPTSLWNLDYIDSKGATPIADGRFLSLYTGDGVHVFLLDTGIDNFNGDELAAHDDITVLPCLDPFIFPPVNPDDDDIVIPDDCNMGNLGDLAVHGTTVAAIVAGKTLGVAKKVKLYIRKVTRVNTGYFLGNNTTMKSKILKEKIDQVVDYISDPSHGISPNTAIINFSAGFHPDVLGGVDPSFEQSLIDARNAGILVVISAGNDPTESADNVSPGRLGLLENGIIDVAAVDIGLNATLADGTVVDIYAPGVGISTAGANIPSSSGGSLCPPISITCNIGGDTNGTPLDGSSYSAPYITGIAAKFIEYAIENNLPHDPAAVEIALKDNALSPLNFNVLGNAKFVNSRFLLLETEPLIVKSEYCFGFNSAQWSSPKGVVGVSNTVDAYTLTGSVLGAPASTFYQGLLNHNIFSVDETTSMYMKACKGNYCSTIVNGSRQARNFGSYCY